MSVIAWNTHVIMMACDAIALEYEAILVVERFEVLQQLGAFGWLPSFVRGRRTLALFQGGRGQFETGPVKFILDRSTVPVLVFFDFDPAALQRAADVPRLEAVCLPGWQDLEPALHRHNRNVTFRSEFACHGVQLDATCCSIISPVWARMKSLRRGLDQDRFPR